jgi:hypothetical protein
MVVSLEDEGIGTMHALNDFDLVPSTRCVHVLPGILLCGGIVLGIYFLHSHSKGSLLEVGFTASPFL